MEQSFYMLQPREGVRVHIFIWTNGTNENSSRDKLSGTINNSEFPSHQKRIGHISACFETETSSNRDT